MPAPASSLIPAALNQPTHTPGLLEGPAHALRQVADLREHLASVPDPRHRGETRHTITATPLIAAAAAPTETRSFTTIGKWAADLPQHLLAAAEARIDRQRGVYRAPGQATLRRVPGLIGGDALDCTIGTWPADQDDDARTIAVDGKNLRDTCDDTTKGGVHLPAPMTHDNGIVVGQREVDGKNNEITRFQPLPSTMDTAGVVVTADALHTQRAHTRHLVEKLGTDHVLTVKENQPPCSRGSTHCPGRKSLCAQTKYGTWPCRATLDPGASRAGGNWISAYSPNIPDRTLRRRRHQRDRQRGRHPGRDQPGCFAWLTCWLDRLRVGFQRRLVVRGHDWRPVQRAGCQVPRAQ
ncbi:ISAs1 family transposase [Amycolatopsis sp. SID8362]|nr:ISAs1 family transposase [Amycolatopsis sp. SID8362]NED44195.1 ISAs1 family transposase [Amycolatopsis sp. SID8362]